MTAMLVVFGGRPGTGKTSIARLVADELAATYLRIDSIEVAIAHAGPPLGDSPAGYTVAHAVAADQLRAGRRVVVDAVHAVAVARAGWVDLGRELGVAVRFVRVVPPDAAEHRRRVESRTADLPGHTVPTWAEVRALVEEPWAEPHLALPNDSTVGAAVTSALRWLGSERGGIERLDRSAAGELLTLQLAAWVSEGRANATIEIPALQEALSDVQAQLADPSLTVWGLRERRRLIATVRTSLIDPHTAFLGRLGVVPDRSRQGLGTEMLQHAERQLPADITRIELITGLHSTGNHAFYERHGYRVTERDEAGGIVRMAKAVAR